MHIKLKTDNKTYRKFRSQREYSSETPSIGTIVVTISSFNHLGIPALEKVGVSYF